MIAPRRSLSMRRHYLRSRVLLRTRHHNDIGFPEEEDADAVPNPSSFFVNNYVMEFHLTFCSFLLFGSHSIHLDSR
jgi:hypothetical protein